jgi:hypothetical protein
LAAAVRRVHADGRIRLCDLAVAPAIPQGSHAHAQENVPKFAARPRTLGHARFSPAELSGPTSRSGSRRFFDQNDNDHALDRLKRSGDEGRIPAEFSNGRAAYRRASVVGQI